MMHTERLEPLFTAAQVGRTRASSAAPKSAAVSATASAPPFSTPPADEATAAKKKKKKKAPYKDLERRREQNRVNAQKSYYRKLVRPTSHRSVAADADDCSLLLPLRECH